jgi:putative SOS response-associated peptidase YedK
MVDQSRKSLIRDFGATFDERAFEELMRARLDDHRISMPRALEANFDDPQDESDRRFRDWILAHRDRESRAMESELFKQTKRLADAERALATKETKTQREHQRIATQKIPWLKEKMRDLKRADSKPRDSQIFPNDYTAVIVNVDGQRLIRPMRYNLRPPFMDADLKGAYNARRDNLAQFWKGQFGTSHAILVMTSFFEHVSRHVYEHRELGPEEKEQDVILHFNPQPPTRMYVVCLWSHWERPGVPALESFAAITDEPPPEVRETGHDRCVVPIKVENIDAWLTPRGRSKEELFAILDDRPRPYYEHRLAA